MNTDVFGANAISNRWLVMLLFVLGIMMYPSKGFAFFSCTSNGQQMVGVIEVMVPVDVTLDKNAAYIALTDMANYAYCDGLVGNPYHDALRTATLSLSPTLTKQGYIGYVEVAGVKYDNPIGEVCIWPSTPCPVRNIPEDDASAKLRVIVGVKALDNGVHRAPLTIPKGSELARLEVDQRSMSAWGQRKTWVFTARSDVVIPSYTCTWSNPNITIDMPTIEAGKFLEQGGGAYPEEQAFDMQLLCEPSTKVSVKFTGQAMASHKDVLANLEDVDNGAVGIQIKYHNQPITLGEVVTVVNQAQATETLHFMAAYFYNGEAISVGDVSALANVEFTYE